MFSRVENALLCFTEDKSNEFDFSRWNMKNIINIGWKWISETSNVCLCG